MTEFLIPAGKVYLSPLIDCYDGMLVAWNISSKPDTQLVNTMLDRATLTLPQDVHPIIYSGRGCHLPMARLDQENPECRAHQVHVEERMFARQFSL